MSPLVFLLAVAKETFVRPRPTFYTHRWGQSKLVLHGMFTRAWQLEQVDNFLGSNFGGISERPFPKKGKSICGPREDWGGRGDKAGQAGEGDVRFGSVSPWPSASGNASGAD